MNTYEAIMRAADHIEGWPKDFHFGADRVPRHCGIPGCALGWIGHYLECNLDSYADVPPKLGFNRTQGYDNFYLEMTRLQNPAANDWIDIPMGQPPWTQDAKACAQTLRKFAERYKAKPAPDAFKPWLADLMRKVEGETIPA